MRLNFCLLLSCLSFAGPSAALAGGLATEFSPASKAFTCDVPPGWTPFEEQEPWGFAVHIVGPDDAQSDYRTGIDIHYFEQGEPGFVKAAKYTDELRRGDDLTDRQSTPVVVMRVGDSLGRLFEVLETRRLPFDGLPAQDRILHHYYAIIPNGGDSYFSIDLSSSRETYLDYREMFTDFLRSFRPSGA